MTEKFIEEYRVTDWEIETDTGWQDVTHVLKTVPYQVYRLELDDYVLDCADDHIVFDSNYTAVFVKDLSPGDHIITDTGPQPVVQITRTGVYENMYDLSVNSVHHRYYTNGVLSHNTTCAAIYITWYAMFHPDQTILIAAHKFSGSQEIMQRIRYVYETCPNFIRAGVKNYNKGSIEFDNDSRIVSTTTTGTTGRGMSISLLYCDEYAYVPPNIADEFWASISPTLATGGRAIITSTPNSDEDMFAQIWKSAENRYDEFGNDSVLGTNGFYALKVNWDEHPDRDEEWSRREIAKIGETKWKREFECISGDSTVTIQHQDGTIQTVTVDNLKDSLPLNQYNDFATNTHEIKILTDTGFSEFDGLTINPARELLCVKLVNSEIKCTPDHEIFLEDLSTQQARHLQPNDTVLTEYGNDTVVEVIPSDTEVTYDVFNVKNNHRFYANNILVKNCQFLVFDETLIDSVRIAAMKSLDPVFAMGQTRWFKKPEPYGTYVVGLDPAMGTGGDYAAIQVIEVPSYIQVAEWRHNGTNIPTQIRIMKGICDYIAERTRNPQNIYWSVENNSIGEAALIVISDLGEENIPGLFVSEPIRKGMVRKYRKGFNTTHSTKLSACSRLKTLVETEKLKINSGALISELKTYVATAASYRAKAGCTDDLISALLLVIRMIVVLKDWDPRVYHTFKTIESDDNWEPPMPIMVSKSFR